LKVEQRDIVVPGDLLADGEYSGGDNTFIDDDMVYATRIGVINVQKPMVSVVALKGCYIPNPGDIVIGKVVGIGLYAWTLDINAPYPGALPASDAFERSFNPQRDELSRYFNLGDYLIAKVVAFDRTRDPLLTVRRHPEDPLLGKITHGRVISIAPTKIPRLIGKKGSMISMLKKETGCHIMIGKNGRVLVSGTPEDETLAAEAIHRIEREAHTQGLTDRISSMIREEKGRADVSESEKE